MKRCLTCLLLVLPLAVPSSGAQDAKVTWARFKADDQRELEYAIALPKGAPKGGSPLLLMLPGSSGDKPCVTLSMSCMAAEGTLRGWIVASPVTPAGRPFYEDGESLIKPLVAQLRKDHRVEEGQVHVAGISAGGTSALSLAVNDPGSWASVLAFPGSLTGDGMARLGALRGKPVTLYVGEMDELGFLEASRQIAAKLEEEKIACKFTIMKGEGHLMRLTAKQVWNDLDRHRKTVKEKGSKKP